MLLSAVMCAKPLRHRNVNIKLYINQIYVNKLFIGKSLCERAKYNIFVKEKEKEKKSKGTTKNRKFRCVYMSNELISKII